jgi:hypothetical protein
MRIDIIDWTIPDFLLPNLINGDDSGLTDNEIAATTSINSHAQRVATATGATSWRWSPAVDQAGFCNSHDAKGIGACDCVIVHQVLGIEGTHS